MFKQVVHIRANFQARVVGEGLGCQPGASHQDHAQFGLLGSFLYAVAFVGNIPWVPKTIDSGPVCPVVQGLIVNLLVLGAFAIQHSVTARPRFKRWWGRFVPQPMERSTYVLLSSLLLILLFWVWQPFPQTIWAVENPAGKALQTGLYWVGWLTVICSTYMINHFELFGLKQAIAQHPEVQTTPLLSTRYLYQFVRHPIMLGFSIAFWATPVMSQGPLLFALMTTAYIFIGIAFEGHDLVASFGEACRAYQVRVPMVFRSSWANVQTPVHQLNMQTSDRVGIQRHPMWSTTC